MPVASRSLASISAIISFIWSERYRTSSSFGSYPGRITPPSFRVMGGSSSMAAAMSSAMSVRGSMAAKISWRPEETASPSSSRSPGSRIIAAPRAVISRGLALP